MSGELPEGWRWAKLGEVCNIVIGRTPRRAEAVYWGGTHPWATISDITASGEVVLGTKECLSDAGAALCNGRLLAAGTLMFSFKLSIGAMAFAGRDLFTNEAIAGLVPKDPTQISIQYLRHVLKVADYDALTGHAVKGRTLNRRTLAQVPLLLPPLDEQGRIASTMELAQQARTAAAAQLEAIDTLSVALLRKISPPSPAARLPRGWRWVKLGDVCVQERKAIAVDDVGYVEMPYLGLEHVEPITGRLLIDGQGNRDSATKSTNFRFSPRHVLYGKLRPYLNKVARPTFSGRCTTEFIPLLPIQADADWLAWILRRDETVAHAMRGKTGSRMPRASMPDLMRLPVALPPLDEQRGIADTMGNVQCMRESAALQLALVDDLNQSQLERLLGMPMETGIVSTCPSHQP